ncbi:hypothetical protein C789_670 [Microcystis aeruginosa FACHB-905 = DIANCHI905]|uniref:Uncharacterized protein n=1 Tax=Microcystis aeruginosa PCC 7806SL TaxID=1903187 RepID=A0AB33BS65_MICA7|nr:hypothetical protein BH695_1433 [Microcystis aeruginosa PCC 7806SL]ELS49544.1 hypothetical protein C789_670 [Microcystis aeruginosa FACHB-905 = DIANCHI905]
MTFFPQRRQGVISSKRQKLPGCCLSYLLRKTGIFWEFLGLAFWSKQ